ncbi:hypothetical protein P378_07310 [Desulforamulus profundi]|uniref:Uncharacterized protein n=1 Tax=Desulforamulus profundi TaxID=1383067 RepID=A0A2C6MHG8_9FIRM|nr:hypothetical protein P378_07310 [Desulforamulus profundi]
MYARHVCREFIPGKEDLLSVKNPVSHGLRGFYMFIYLFFYCCLSCILNKSRNNRREWVPGTWGKSGSILQGNCSGGRFWLYNKNFYLRASSGCTL